MQVDLTALAESENLMMLLAFALVLSIVAVLTKVLGSGVPAFAMGFGRLRGWRIGVGMTPRGEVALIVAEIGRATGIISQDIFTVSIIMTVVTTVIAPILLVRAFDRKAP